MTTLIQRVKSRPLWYATRAVSPRFWAGQATVHLSRRRASAQANQLLSLLRKMHDGELLDLVSYRDRGLSEMLEYAYQHCRYYRELFDELGVHHHDLGEFTRLPLLDKATIRICRDDIVSDEIDRLDFTWANTGGSTGEPLEFPRSFTASIVDSVHQEFLYGIMGYEPGDKIVGLAGAPVPDNLRRSHVYWTEHGSKDIPYGRVSYSSLYLTRQTMPYYLEHLLEIQPSILRGYPSFLNDVAGYIVGNNISVPFQVKGVELTAENAYDWQIQNIRIAFDTKVFFQYGHAEGSVFAYTVDDSYDYFCSPFYGLTEVLDAEGRQVDRGEVGEVVVTGFHNVALPFVRYRTGDMAVFNGDEHGIVRLGKIIGRTQDYIYTNDGGRVALTALVFGQHLHAFRNINKWQLVQNTRGEIVVRIVRGEGFSRKDQEEIRSKLENACAIHTDFEFVDSIPLTPAGKHMFLVQNVEL